MNLEQIKTFAQEVLDGKSRSYVQAAHTLATFVISLSSAEREELIFIKSYLSHQDQDADHGFMVRRIDAVLAGKDPSPDVTAALAEMHGAAEMPCSAPDETYNMAEDIETAARVAASVADLPRREAAKPVGVVTPYQTAPQERQRVYSSTTGEAGFSYGPVDSARENAEADTYECPYHGVQPNPEPSASGVGWHCPECPSVPAFSAGDRVRMPNARARHVKNDEHLTGEVVGHRPGGFVLVKDSEGDETLWRPSSLVRAADGSGEARVPIEERIRGVVGSMGITDAAVAMVAILIRRIQNEGVDRCAAFLDEEGCPEGAAMLRDQASGQFTREADPLSVGCPWCDVLPGVACMNASGALPAGTFHTQRREKVGAAHEFCDVTAPDHASSCPEPRAADGSPSPGPALTCPSCGGPAEPGKLRCAADQQRVDEDDRRSAGDGYEVCVACSAAHRGPNVYHLSGFRCDRAAPGSGSASDDRAWLLVEIEGARDVLATIQSAAAAEGVTPAKFGEHMRAIYDTARARKLSLDSVLRVAGQFTSQAPEKKT